MTKINKEKEFKDYIQKLNFIMDSYLERLSCEPLLKRAMKYSIDAGGKRMRPLLFFATYKGIKQEIDDKNFVISGSLEFMHTYSLIHDDLPEMDNDDLRRGKPTSHRVFGQGMAVLVGDALLTSSFEWLINSKINDAKLVKLIKLLSKSSGAQGMIDGQVKDITFENSALSLENVKKIHEKKTGKLIEYACIAAGIYADATKKQLKLIKKFGKEFGLAFQIYDDILDVISTADELGKKVHKDEKEGKNTYPKLLTLKGAISSLNETLERIDKILNKLCVERVDISYLSELTNYFKIGNGYEKRKN